MANLDISEFITRMEQAFIPAKAAGIDATIQLKLTGASSAEWFGTIKDANAHLPRASHPRPA